MAEILSYLSLSTCGLIIASLFVISFIIQQLYIWNVYGRVAFSKSYSDKHRESLPPQEGVSVVICARNEKEAIEQNLAKFLEQDYPTFEVILVNDCSEDDSDVLLGKLQGTYPNLMVRHIVKDEVFSHGKPMAMGVGIKAAKYEWILFTDIDCEPQNAQWLSAMQPNFAPTIDVVMGYTRYPKVKKMYRANLFFSSLHFLGSALQGRAYMANCKNYAYRRSLFFDRKGFDIRMTTERENIAFVGCIAGRKNTAVELSKEAINVSTQAISTRHWKQLKASERVSHRFHGSKKRFPALLNNLTIFTLLLFGVLLATQGFEMLVAVGAGFALHLAALGFVLAKACKRLGEKGLVLMLIFYSLIAPFVSFSFLFHGKQFNKYS